MPRVSNMHIKRGAIISEVAERFELSKMKIQKKIHSVKRRFDDKKESVKQYKEKMYVEDRTSAYKKAKYQESPKVQLLYVKCRY